MAVAEINEGVRRLAQFRPFERGGIDLRAVLRDLVLAAAAINGGRFSSLAECRDAFRALWGLEVEVDEVRQVVVGLQSDGLADREGGGFALRPEPLEILEKTAQRSKDTEAQALLEWEEAVRRLRPDLTTEDFDCLREDLKEWLNKIIARHGMEAALMLYPEEARAHVLFEQIDAYGFGFLPKRAGCAGEIREEALRLFVRQPTQAQRRFLADRLNTTFYMTVLTLDPEARKLAELQATGHRVYLDTNFLYALLGAAPATEIYSAQRLVELTRNLGYELAVTPWTVNELRTSIQRTQRSVDQQERLMRPELAELMLKASGDTGFRRAFWKAYRDSHTRPRDYFDRVSHFEHDLEKIGISVVAEGCINIDRLEGPINEFAALLDRIVGMGNRDDVVLKHDAKHRLLIERMRGDGNIRFSNARYWFLTQDTRLPRFAAHVPPEWKAEPPELPFCISPSAWVQVMRALTPRTEDYESTVVDLLASPYVGYRRIDQRVVLDVVGRMDQFEDASPELAFEVLADTATVERIVEAQNEGDEEKIAARVREGYSAKARELREQAQASAEIAAEAEQRATQAAEGWETERLRREGLESDLRREREGRDAEARGLEERIARIEESSQRQAGEAREKQKELERQLARDETRRRRSRRVAAGLVLAVLGVAGGALPILLGAITEPAAVVALVVAASLVLFVGVRVAAGAKWGGEIAMAVGIVLAVAGIALAIVFQRHDDGNSSHGKRDNKSSRSTSAP